jgi:hypothetical protein
MLETQQDALLMQAWWLSGEETCKGDLEQRDGHVLASGVVERSAALEVTSTRGRLACMLRT